MSISTHPLSYLLLNAEEQYRKVLRSIVGYPWSLLMSLVSIMAESRKTQANEISQEVSPSSSNSELRSNDQFCFILSTIGKESLKDALYLIIYKHFKLYKLRSHSFQHSIVNVGLQNVTIRIVNKLKLVNCWFFYVFYPYIILYFERDVTIW